MGLIDRWRQRQSMRSLIERRMSTPPERNTREWLAAYGTNPRLSPVTKIATDLAAAEGKLWREQPDGTRTEITTHPFLDFWRQPNPLPELTSAAIWRVMEVWRLLKGEAYAVIERDGSGMPRELWPIPPHWVAEIPHLDASYYVVQTNDGRRQLIPVADMFVVRDLNPLDPYGRGLGQAEAVADEVESYEYASKFAKRIFYNNARPDFIITAPGITEDQARIFQASFERKYSGIYNAYKMGIIPYKDVNIHRMSDSPREMDFVASRKDLRDTVNSHFGVPPELLGIVENSNRATANAAKAIYAENVLTPILRARQDAINRQLLVQFGGDVVWEYEDIIPQDEEYKLKVANAGLSGGAITINEWREQQGIDPLPNGDVLLVGGMLVPYSTKEQLTQVVRQDDYPTPEYNAPSNPKPPISVNAVTLLGQKSKQPPVNRQVLLRRMTAEQQAAERSATRQVQRYLSRQLETIIAALDGHKAADDPLSRIMTVDLSGILKEAVAQVYDSLGTVIDWDAQAADMAKVMEPVWQSSYNAGARAATDLYGITGVRQPSLTEALRAEGAARIKGITDTTRKELARTLATGVEAGESRAQLMDRVRETMPKIQDGRASVIAGNETHMSIQRGNFDMLKAAGYTSKTWLTSGDADVRSTHSPLNGKTIPIDDRYPNGCLYPGDPTGPVSEIINCRCEIVAGDDADPDIPDRQSVQTTHGHGMLGSGADYDEGGTVPATPDVLDTIVGEVTPDAARAMLDKYEPSIAGKDYETAIIVSPSGKVYSTKGHLTGVNIHGVPDDELHGAYMSHNHPDSVTYYSFSKFDISEAIKYNFSELRGFDSEYEYIMRVLPETIRKEDYIIQYEFATKYNDEALDRAMHHGLDMDVDGYHYICKRMSEDYEFYYERRPKK